MMESKIVIMGDIQVEPKPKDFEFYSKYFIKQLKDEHAQLTRWLRYTEKRMEDLSSGSEVYIKQEELLVSYQQRIEENENKMQEPMDGDNELFLKYVTEQLVIKERQILHSKRKKESVVEKKKQQENCMRKFYATESKYNRQNRQTERDMNHFYEKMQKIEHEMPDYLKESLARMPCNKGYIYRGIWYFGHVPVPPEEDQYLTMFERVKGIQYIHEYIHEYPYRTYNLYEKLSKNSPKTLIHHEVAEMRG